MLMLLGLTLLQPIQAEEYELPAEVSALKPRCDKMLQDIRDANLDEIVKGFHPMMQTWNQGKLAQKMAMRSIKGYQRTSGGVAVLDFTVFSPEESGFRTPEGNLKLNYPDATRVAKLGYNYEFTMLDGNKHIGGTDCLLFEDKGQWYFYDNLPF